MDIVCSTVGIVNTFRPGQGILDIANAGFENISLDLDMSCPAYELEHYGRLKKKAEEWEHLKEYTYLPISEHPSEIQRYFEKMLFVSGEKHLNLPFAMAPYLPRDSKRKDLKELLLSLHKESIRFCGRIGCRYLVIRPMTNVSGDREASSSLSVACNIYGSGWEVNRDYYLCLAAEARQNQVILLLENQCHSMNGHMIRGICSDGYIVAEWIDALNREVGEERFGFCMDVGVCSLCGQDMHEFSRVLGKRIKAVILRDCDGQQEGSMLPFTCAYSGQPRTDWLNLIRGLRETGFDGQLVLDFRDTACTFSPILRPQLMVFAKAVADYFKWQIEIENLLKKYSSIALFGAGNMCRNYMKCYGEKYPPLFTCDNNQKVWGTEFCGLEVKSPEALKEVPEGCGIFICNIYYREIEQQLRDMGIENIEFFNDEYMPSFHFDRLRTV